MTSPNDRAVASDAPNDPPPRRRPLFSRQRLIRLGKKLGVLYLIWLALLFFGQRWVIFPDFASPEPSSAEKYDTSTVVLARDIGEGEKVIAWFVPSAAARKGKPSPLVIYFHGNAEIIDTQDYPIEMYRSMGCSILLPEFRGYGRAAGQPSQAALVDDAIYFFDEAMKRLDVDATRVFFHGRSIGSGVAAQLAMQRKPRVLILGSAFTSLRPFAHRYLAPAFLIRSPFDTDRVLPTLDIPILIHHGTNDDIVPVENGRTLSRLARHGVYIELDCKHNDFPGDGNDEKYVNDIREFLTKNAILP